MIASDHLPERVVQTLPNHHRRPLIISQQPFSPTLLAWTRREAARYDDQPKPVSRQMLHDYLLSEEQLDAVYRYGGAQLLTGLGRGHPRQACAHLTVDRPALRKFVVLPDEC